MKIIVDLSADSYPIFFEKNFDNIKNFFTPFLKPKCGLITNQLLWSLYGSEIQASFINSVEIIPIIIDDSEQNKNLKTIEYIINTAVENGLSRNSCLIALGGGVIGDITGFAASVFMRGIPFLQIPTTLLAQIDSSIGGKTGVNTNNGKNLIGTFKQPKAVYINFKTLKTLSAKERSCGMAELIKYGFIYDKNIIEQLLQNSSDIEKFIEIGASIIIEALIENCCKIKAEIVSRDEKEKNERRLLNFGHTVGHAIETLGNYSKYSHGESVGLGMLAACKIAEQHGICSPELKATLKQLLTICKLPTEFPDYDTAKIIELMQHDKKSQENNICMILPENYGKMQINEKVEQNIIARSLDSLRLN